MRQAFSGLRAFGEIREELSQDQVTIASRGGATRREEGRLERHPSSRLRYRRPAGTAMRRPRTAPAGLALGNPGDAADLSILWASLAPVLPEEDHAPTADNLSRKSVDATGKG